MTRKEYSKIPPGLYRVHWKCDPDRHSLASVGMLDDGSRWLAPINWVIPAIDPAYKVWKAIARVEKVDAGSQKITNFTLQDQFLEILKKHMSECTCDEAYKSRGLTAPDCCWCNEHGDVVIGMQEAYDLGRKSSLREQFIDCPHCNGHLLVHCNENGIYITYNRKLSDIVDPMIKTAGYSPD